MIPICVVDAFTDAAFGGNPAAVCRLDRPADAVWMQHVATEMNLSETAFLVERTDGALDLRWFTPAAEVALCGHATLASAHVLGGDATFHTLSGVLTCRKESDGWIEMDFPALPAGADHLRRRAHPGPRDGRGLHRRPEPLRPRRGARHGRRGPVAAT